MDGFDLDETLAHHSGGIDSSARTNHAHSALSAHCIEIY
jgi:hypothetical protein